MFPLALVANSEEEPSTEYHYFIFTYAFTHTFF